MLHSGNRNSIRKWSDSWFPVGNTRKPGIPRDANLISRVSEFIDPVNEIGQVYAYVSAKETDNHIDSEKNSSSMSCSEMKIKIYIGNE